MRHFSPLWQLFLMRARDFYREPAAVFWVYGFPLFLAIALGVAFSQGGPDAPMSRGEMPIAIGRDQDSAEVGALQHVLQENQIATVVVRPEEGRERLRAGKVSLVVVPTAGGYDYYFDPQRTDSSLARFRVDDVVQHWKGGSSAWPTVDRPSSEPGDRYVDFLIPGLIGFNLMGGGLWGVGWVIVDLRVRKLLKLFLATPMRRRDFLLSIVGSRLVFLLPETLVLILAGVLLFRVPENGNPLTLALVVLLGGAAFAGIGLLLASRAQRAETVSGIINLITMPLWMFSGTFFSPARFPTALQPVIQASPLTHLNDALREVMLEGASLATVGWRLAILAAWAVVTFVLAVKWFRWH